MATTAEQNLSMELDPKYDNYDYPTTAPSPQPGHPGYLTSAQQAAVYALRKRLEQLGEPDEKQSEDDGYQLFREDHSYRQRLDTLTLLRFLRARKFDIDLTFKMFVDCEKWRKEIVLDKVLPEWTYPEKAKLFKFYPQYYHKTDKDGRPVYIEKLGGIDLQAMYQLTTPERMLMNLAVEYERVADPRLPACSRKAGVLLETCCTIMDLDGVGLGKVSQVYSYLKQASAMSQNYYPERLGRLYVINAPWGFSTVWNMIKGWLDEVTANKIKILGRSYHKELFTQIPIHNLPKEFGGHCECPGGCELSDMGPWRESEWSRPAWWEKKTVTAAATADTTIQGAPAEVKEGAEAAAEPSAQPTTTAEAAAPVPAAAPAPTVN